MSSPGSAILRLELPRWLAVDTFDAAVWIALAVALERIAGPAGLVPGVSALAVAVIGAICTMYRVRRRRQTKAVLLEPGALGLEAAGGCRTPLTLDRGTRAAGHNAFLDGRAGPEGRPWTCWLTSWDVGRGPLRGLSRTLYLRAGVPPEA